MTFIQLLITGIVIAGVVMIGLLAIIPSLLEYPEAVTKMSPSCRRRLLSSPTIATTKARRVWRPELLRVTSAEIV